MFLRREKYKNAEIQFKGKDTTYGAATGSRYGLVKLGDNTKLETINSTDKVYPVQATADGKLGVYVPWTDSQKLPQTQLAVAGKDDSNSHTAVSSGPVYINTYDVIDKIPRHTGAISIEGKNGISVTAQPGGKIEISGHEKPANLGGKTGDGLLVPAPTSTDTEKYLKANGTWDTPTDTKVTYRVDSTDKVITSLASGTGISFGFSNGKLTINGPASSRAAKAGTGLTEDDSISTTERYLNLKGATFDTVSSGNIISGLGGIKIGTGGSKQFNYTWNNPGEAEPGWSASTTDIPVTVYQPNRANGKYYPVECTKDSAAVVCIPNVPSPFYEEGTTDNDKFTFAIEQYKVAYNYGMPIFAFTGDKGGSAFNDSLTAYNEFMSNNNGQAISPEDAEYITSSSFIDLTITCPSNIIFAQLDRPIYAPTYPGYTMNGSIISTIAEGKQQISIQNSNPAIGFPADSITVGNPGYASLKFATADQLDSNDNIISKGHTYNATIKIWYEEANPREGIIAGYKSDIII